MKTKILILTFVAFTFTAKVFAAETPQMKVIPMVDAKLLISFNQYTPVVNTISIYSESGEMMYIKKMKKGTASYQRVYDLSKVENGNYEVTLKYGKNMLKKTIKVNDGKVTVSQEKADLPPVFTEADNGLNLTYLNFEKSDISISVYDNKRQLIKTAKLGSEFSICKKLNLAALEKGEYNILLASAEKEYWFSVYR